MQTRILGASGEQLTTIGLGTWAIGGSWSWGWGTQDDAESVRTIHRALGAGINWVDTAPVYGFGHSEEVVGRALRELDTRPFVATKCSRLWDADGNISAGMKAKSVRTECDASLQRLGIDVIDLYQIHWPEPDEEIEEGWSTVAELIEVGKVRFGGLSNFSLRQIRRCQGIHPVTSLQPPYSMLRRDVEAALLTFCAEAHIGVIPYSPLQKGLLTGKVNDAWMASLAKDDHRHKDPMFLEPRLSENLARVDELLNVADRLGLTLGQLAIAWVLRRAEVTSAIVGARRPGQVEETIPAADIELSPADIDEMETILA